jgi:zinc protease
MFQLFRCLAVLLLLFAVPLQAAGDSTWFYKNSDIPPDPAWQFGTLPNGLRYAVRRNALPEGQVSIRLRIDAGSLNEADHERGWAHFVEHLAFRGTKSFGDREARHLWQQLGASFGSDTNASTDPTETIYQLDLPHADRPSLDKSLAILAEMADSALFDPAMVEAERKIVLAEKGRRPEIAVKVDAVARPLFYSGLTYEKRDPIGTDATLAAATAEGLRSFYERWYRPERATLILVGDADPAMLVELVEKHFSSWRPSGPPPQEPDDGRVAEVSEAVASIAYPGAPISLTAAWVRPHVDSPNTVAQTEVELAERLAAQIIGRRLEAKARGDAAFINAGIGFDRARRIVDMTQLSLTAKDGRWSDALSETFAIVTDSLRSPPSATEIAREMSNLRTALNSAVAGETTIRSQQRAQQMVHAIDTGDVTTTPAEMLAIFDRLAPKMTPARIGQTMKDLFVGSGPRLLLLTPQPVKGGKAELASALSAAQKVAPATRATERSVSFDMLPPLGPPGREISRQRIEDMDVTIIRFANGSSLTFKQTEYEKGLVLVQLRFGSGLAGLPPDRSAPGWMTPAVTRSGLADLDLDAMERLLTGRRMNISFGVDENALVLAGVTNAEDLPDQLRLLATKLDYPRWDASQFARLKTAMLEGYEMSFASASARGGRELGAVIHPGDARWLPTEKPEIAATTPADFQRFFAPLLATGPVDAIIVGDVTLDAAVAAMARTIGALPARAAAPRINDAVVPPVPNPKPVTFTHEGDANQAYATIGWSTFGGTTRNKELRALSGPASRS